MRWDFKVLKTVRTIAACAAVAFAVSSCALVKSPEAPRETYDISAPDDFSGLRGGTRSQILVKLPTALKSIDSDRFIVKPSPAVITYLAGAQWSDTVPRMVQAKLVEAFENTGATGATAKPGDGLVIDYQLVSSIRRFEISNGSAVIEISIKLLADKTGLVRETRIFTAKTNSGGDTADAYVAAFDASFDELARSIVRWVVNQT
ncbi:MAG: ABC-type transport auxiliary lipoprotein family protein [Rhizobiaceae bacterium]